MSEHAGPAGGGFDEAFALAAPVMVVLVVADWSEGGPYSGRGSFRIAS